MNKLALSLAVSAALALTACSDDDDDNKTTTSGVTNPDIGGGKVLIYSTEGTFIDAANVGNLPDNVVFAMDNTLVTANEGEPSDDYNTDPEGSISIIELGDGRKVQTVTTLDFSDVEVAADVRLKPDTDASVDLEPEYVAVSSDGATAWVSLQENNAVAIVDLTGKAISSVKSLGEVEWQSRLVDIVDDGTASPDTAPANVFALYQPDTMVGVNIGGVEYFVSANEGDDRDYDGWVDYEKAKDLEDEAGDSSLSSELQTALLDTDMESLRVFVDMGQDDNGIYQALYMAGTRSFSIWNADGEQVYDSGSDFEEHLAGNFASVFNTRVDDTDDADDIAELDSDGVTYELIGDTAYFWEGVDARSLKKGVEPEALAVAAIGDKVYAYIGLEKQGGFFVYDISTPQSASMIEYVNDIDYNALPSQAGDLAPEGMVAFEQDGNHYLAVANELSSTVALYELSSTGSATKLTSLSTGSFDEGAAEILSYDNGKLFVTNAEETTVDIIDVSNPTAPVKSGNIDFSEHSDSLQSVSARNGIVAIAVE